MSASPNGANESYPLLIIDLDTGREIGARALELSSQVTELSPTELVELELVSRGLKEVSAAKERWVSPETVKVHRQRIRDKLGSPNMSGAIRIAIERSILSPEKKPIPPRAELTPTEIEILILASLGMSLSQSAEARGKSRETIKAQRKAILRKFNTETIAGAVMIGFEYGYLEPTDVEDS